MKKGDTVSEGSEFDGMYVTKDVRGFLGLTKKGDVADQDLEIVSGPHSTPKAAQEAFLKEVYE